MVAAAVSSAGHGRAAVRPWYNNTTVLELRPGALVSQSLRLVQPLGQGGMGSVWLAQHLTLDTEVAVKFIRPERADDRSLLTRFEREAKSAARISSPHVVQIKDYGLADDRTPYIVMEHLRGASLREVLEQAGQLSLRQVSELVSGVAEALGAAHALGIVHRDIKPQNIFLVDGPSAPRSLVKVLDFGVAKVLGEGVLPGGSEITETGMVIGSPPYMSPEQLEGRKDIDQRADTWSLAIVAYRALCGRLPFDGGSLIAVGAAVLGGRYTPVTTHRPELPAAVDDWFAKALCLEVAGRFQSARELREAFLKLLEHAASEPRAGANALPPSTTLEQATTAPHQPADPPASQPGAAEEPASLTQPAQQPQPAQLLASETASSIAMEPRSPAPLRWRRVGIAAAAMAAAGLVALLMGERHGSPQGPSPSASATTAPSSSPLTAADCPAGMTFIVGGAFDMGSSAGDDVRKNETPRHRVHVQSFCLDITEVTVRAYSSCQSCGPLPDTVEGKEITARAQTFWSQFCNANQPDRADHPMNCVSWDQARAYCAVENKRLPSEEEWELAARGPSGRAYPWGDSEPSPLLVNACGAECSNMLNEKLRAIGGSSWSAMYPQSDSAPATAKVGSFARGASPQGVHDLAGNVWEWTASSYCYYDEVDCTESRRVLRGGGWDVPDANAVRATRRHPGAPNGRGHNIGFRCAFGAG